MGSGMRNVTKEIDMMNVVFMHVWKLHNEMTISKGLTETP